MRQFRLPVLWQLARLGNLVDVRGQRQRHHLRFKPVDHGARLTARSTMAGLDRGGGIALGNPVGAEDLVELAVKLARRVIADVQQRFRAKFRRRGDRKQGHRQRADRSAQKARHGPTGQTLVSGFDGHAPVVMLGHLQALGSDGSGKLDRGQHGGLSLCRCRALRGELSGDQGHEAEKDRREYGRHRRAPGSMRSTRASQSAGSRPSSSSATASAG